MTLDSRSSRGASPRAVRASPDDGRRIAPPRDDTQERAQVGHLLHAWLGPQQAAASASVPLHRQLGSAQVTPLHDPSRRADVQQGAAER